MQSPKQQPKVMVLFEVIMNSTVVFVITFLGYILITTILSVFYFLERKKHTKTKDKIQPLLTVENQISAAKEKAAKPNKD